MKHMMFFFILVGVIIFFVPSIVGVYSANGTNGCVSPSSLSCFEQWRREFTGMATTTFGDLTGDGRVSLADFEEWRRRFTGSNGPPTASPSPATSPTGGMACTLVPTSIISDGSRDVTADLQTAIDAATDNSCLALRPGGLYWVEGGLTINNKNGFVLEGNSAEIFAKFPGPTNIPKYSRRHLTTSFGSNITIQNLKIKGPNPVAQYVGEHEFEHGVAILSGSHIVLKDLTVTNVYGDGVFISGASLVPGSGMPEIPATDVKVLATVKGKGGSFKIDIVGRQGFALGNADGILIDGVDMGLIARSIVDMESIRTDQRIKNLQFVNNEVNHANLNFIAAGGAGLYDNILVKNNHLSGMSMHGKMGNPAVGLKDRLNFTFEANVSDFVHQGNAPLIALNGFQGFRFINNTQPFATGSNAFVIIITDSCDIAAQQNRVTNARGLFTGDLSCTVVDGGGNLF